MMNERDVYGGLFSPSLTIDVDLSYVLLSLRFL